MYVVSLDVVATAHKHVPGFFTWNSGEWPQSGSYRFLTLALNGALIDALGQRFGGLFALGVAINQVVLAISQQQRELH